MNKIIMIIFAAIAPLFLTSCMPNQYQAESNSAKCSSTTEIKKVATKSQYKTRGQCYTVMKSSKNYEEKGVASWYGKKFHRKRTSSGERYNMYKMTAAHKTLPLSTRVLVTNLKNGRKIIVKVNDRGPFIDNRLIDLSYSAAKKLGMVRSGTAPVSVKALA